MYARLANILPLEGVDVERDQRFVVSQFLKHLCRLSILDRDMYYDIYNPVEPPIRDPLR